VYAIGGLARGESKDDFWKVVNQCCAALPESKPRYLMGVGHPLDLVVCTTLGVDMYDCVYPTRTARFGVALGEFGEEGVGADAGIGNEGTLRLKSAACQSDIRPILQGCRCQACVNGYTRARLHGMLKKNKAAGVALAVRLVTMHNLCYMQDLTKRMRQAIIEQTYESFCRGFLNLLFPSGNVPQWVKDALTAAGILI